MWDHSDYTKNKLIGVGQLIFSKLLKLDGVWRTPITLYYKKKIAGHLYIDVRFERKEVDKDAFKAYIDEEGQIVLEHMRQRRL
mmetsp:Transcript_12127/g.10450  ORF Transcript_12127/g.10450 Transcript_12127/m.10450 type:complete len:83 (+) Transcript_12127:268-516(+)